MRRKSKILVAL